MNPCHRMTLGDPLIGNGLVADDQRGRTIGGRTGLVEPDRIPQHVRRHHLLQRDVRLVQMRQRVLSAVESVLDRHHRPDVRRRARSADVRPDQRSEVAAGPRTHRLGEGHRNRQGPHGIRLRLLLPRHRQHPAVLAGLHQARGYDAGRSTHRPRGVHPDQRLTRRAHGVGHEQLGHHDAFEEVGCLADDDGIDIVESGSAVG